MELTEDQISENHGKNVCIVCVTHFNLLNTNGLVFHVATT